MHLVHNEADQADCDVDHTIAAALIAAGAVAPIAAVLYGLSALPVQLGRWITLALACVTIGCGIHFLARAQLGRLRE